MATPTEGVDLGHSGAGDNCIDKAMPFAINGAVAGRPFGVIFVYGFKYTPSRQVWHMVRLHVASYHL